MNNPINIDDLLAVKYTENGRSIEEGFDCYGLAIEVSRRFGHEIPDLEEARSEGRDFMACLKKGVELANVKEVDFPEEPSDVIFFENLQGATNHIGIYLGDNLFIHCGKYGVTIGDVRRCKHFIGRCYRWQ